MIKKKKDQQEKAMLQEKMEKVNVCGHIVRINRLTS